MLELITETLDGLSSSPNWFASSGISSPGLQGLSTGSTFLTLDFPESKAGESCKTFGILRERNVGSRLETQVTGYFQLWCDLKSRAFEFAVDSDFPIIQFSKAD